MFEDCIRGIGRDFEREAEGELIIGGGRGQQKVIGYTGEILRGFRSETGHPGGQPSLRRDSDLCAAGGNGRVDFACRMTNRRGEDGSAGSEGEPALFFFRLAGVVGMGFASSAHEAWANGGDADAFVSEFGVKTFGEADQGELAGDLGQHMRHSELATKAGDVDDGGVVVDGIAAEQMR